MARSRVRFSIGYDPSEVKWMIFWYILPKLLLKYLPSKTIIMQLKHTNQLLEMIVNGGLVQLDINIIQSAIPYDDWIIRVKLHSCCFRQGLRMNFEARNVPHDEAFQFIRVKIKAGNTVLGVTFEREAVVEYGR